VDRLEIQDIQDKQEQQDYQVALVLRESLAGLVLVDQLVYLDHLDYQDHQVPLSKDNEDHLEQRELLAHRVTLVQQVFYHGVIHVYTHSEKKFVMIGKHPCNIPYFTVQSLSLAGR